MRGEYTRKYAYFNILYYDLVEIDILVLSCDKQAIILELYLYKWIPISQSTDSTVYKAFYKNKQGSALDHKADGEGLGWVCIRINY